MLRLIGRLADGWWPTVPALKPGDLAAGNAVIDAAAARAGREPHAIRRLLNLGEVHAPARDTAAELARLALEDGIGTFIVTVKDPRAMADFAAEVAPRVREAVEKARQRGPGASPAAVGAAAVDASRSDPPQRPGPLGRLDPAAAGPLRPGGDLHRTGTPRLEAADRRA
jgi:alkanesulfonate monooxygenase SsuD/methylene tetrahydromethanopterin reductase-like flavin-dependent oxidoreductase (luciferase family)